MAFVKPKLGSGWVDVSTEFTQRHAIIAIGGETDTGKTTLALTGRGPVAILHGSEKVKGVLEPHVRKGKRVQHHNFSTVFPKDEVACAEMARKDWAKARELYDNAYAWAGTIVIDTEYEFYALRRFARFGTLTPKGNIMDLYGVINADWKQMFSTIPRDQPDRGVSVVTIHTMSDVYKDVISINKQGKQVKTSERTGELKMDGQKQIKYYADVILQTMRDPVTEQFAVKIVKPWWRGDVRGVVLDDEILRSMGYAENPATGSCITLPAIMSFITETPEGEWLT